MRFSKVSICSAAILAAFASAPVLASGPTLSDVLKNSGANISGHLSGGYNYNFNDTDTGLAGRSFDGDTDSFLLNQAWLNLSSTPASGFGATVNLMYGEDAELLNAVYGDDDSSFTAVQAFVSYQSGALTVIGGRFVTLAGAEVINDTANANISRSALFTFAQPAVHTGVRGSWKFSDTVTAHLGLNNSSVGGQVAEDNNDQKTIEVGLALAPSKTSSLALSYYDGIEDSDGAGENLSLRFLDLVGSLQVSDALQLAINASHADFEDALEVTGVAGYLNYRLGEKCRLSFRAEWLEFDEDGGSSEDLMTYTLTYGHAFAPNFELLVEARLDEADEDIYIDGADLEDTQPSAALKGIFKF